MGRRRVGPRAELAPLVVAVAVTLVKGMPPQAVTRACPPAAACIQAMSAYTLPPGEMPDDSHRVPAPSELATANLVLPAVSGASGSLTMLPTMSGALGSLPMPPHRP